MVRKHVYLMIKLTLPPLATIYMEKMCIKLFSKLISYNFFCCIKHGHFNGITIETELIFIILSGKCLRCVSVFKVPLIQYCIILYWVFLVIVQDSVIILKKTHQKKIYLIQKSL